MPGQPRARPSAVNLPTEARLLHPKSALSIELRSSGRLLSEHRSEARYHRDPAQSPEQRRLGSARRAREALAVRSDQLISEGYELFSEQSPLEHLAHLSPWREWLAVERAPGRLVEHWAAFGAPEMLVERLLTHVVRVRATPQALRLQLERHVISCGLPLHPETIEAAPAVLHPFLSTHSRVAVEGQYVFGWRPPGVRRSLARAGFPANAFHFLTEISEEVVVFVREGRLELFNEYDDLLPRSEPPGEFVPRRMLIFEGEIQTASGEWWSKREFLRTRSRQPGVNRPRKRKR